MKKKDPIVQLEASKLSTKNLFSDLLTELKGFKYQITLDVLLKKYKHNGEIEFGPVYFNSVKKTVTNHMFRLEKSFEKVLYAIDVWINNGSGWIRHINLLNKHPEKVLKNDKTAVVELSYDRI